MNLPEPDIQVIACLVVTDEEGRVLFMQHDPDDERWSLIGGDLRPYQHPDERAKEALETLPWLAWSDLRMVNVRSFRGRRGWHVIFDYHVSGRGVPDRPSQAWFSPGSYPRTVHGRHEIETVEVVLAKAPLSIP